MSIDPAERRLHEKLREVCEHAALCGAAIGPVALQYNIEMLAAQIDALIAVLPLRRRAVFQQAMRKAIADRTNLLRHQLDGRLRGSDAR